MISEERRVDRAGGGAGQDGESCRGKGFRNILQDPGLIGRPRPTTRQDEGVVSRPWFRFASVS